MGTSRTYSLSTADPLTGQPVSSTPCRGTAQWLLRVEPLVTEPATIATGLAALACGGFTVWRRRHGSRWASAIILLLAGPAWAQPSPEQNAAAFSAAAALTRQSFHWDTVSGGIPQVATTPRTLLPGTTLTTISWNPDRPELYQRKTIDAVDVECTLVATFTEPFATWTAPPGTVTELSFSQSGTSHFIMPWVTAGDSLREYLRRTYFRGAEIPSPLEAQRRIQQAVGLPANDRTTTGLALFWVPLANLARPAYSADISVQLPTLPTFGDGSYQAVATGAPAGFAYLDDSDSTKTYATLAEFIEWNQAQTGYPWTAMGYCYNWNSLQASGTNPVVGFDPLAPLSPFGVSEFIVSAGSKIVNEGFVPHSQLGVWAVPEPSAWVIAVVGLVGLRLWLAGS